MIIQAAVASIAFLALTALAVDWGVKLIARGQAQRAADAGALAGAVSLAYDNTTDLTDAGLPKRNAREFARANAVFGQPPAVNITSDVTFIECPPPDGGPGTTCVQVDAYRNNERANPLPSLFSRLVGVTEQGVKATATAKVLNGTQTECLRPWVVIDRWDEFNGTEPDDPDTDWCGGAEWGTGCGAPSTYDKYSDNKGKNPPQENDRYVPPAYDGSSAGTGFKADGPGNDVGKRFALKVQTNDGLTPGWGLAVDLPRADSTNLGANAYGDNILSCNRKTVNVNNPNLFPCPTDANQLNSWDQQVYWAEKGCLRVQTGTMQGPTSSNVDALVALDPKAQWDTGTPSRGVINSGFSQSPRIVPVAILNIDSYLAQNPTGSGGVISIVNIFGFFIEGMGDYDDTDGSIQIKNGGKAVIGRLMKINASGKGAQLHNTASWSKIIVLVR